MKYFIATNGQPSSEAFSIEQLAAMNIAPDTLVWAQGMPDWVPASSVPELSRLFMATPPPPQYAPGQQYYQQQPYQQYQPCPKTWLVESILATLFCCLPFGIVGIIKASEVSSAYNSGNYQRALQASASAGKWTKISFACGLISILLSVLYYVAIFGIAGAALSNY